MRFCVAHFARLQCEVKDRDISPEQVSELVSRHMGFDRVGADECPVCVAVRDAAVLAETRWVAVAVLAILARTEPL